MTLALDDVLALDAAALAFRRVAEAQGPFLVPPGQDAAMPGAALWDLERLGLVGWLGERRGWVLTPAGEARWTRGVDRG